MVTRNLLTGAHGSPQLTNPTLNHNYKEAKRSLDLISELGEVTMLPGHGKPWKGDMAEAVDLALNIERVIVKSFKKCQINILNLSSLYKTGCAHPVLYNKLYNLIFGYIYHLCHFLCFYSQLY